MIIQHNIMALNSYNKLSGNNSAVQKNLEKLSSGYRINRAGDDAAGLAISEKMRAQITGLDRAKLNAQDGISLVQTAEGALTEVHSILNRLVELGTESANGIYQADDRQKIQDEVTQSLEEIDRISKATNFNGINLLDGSLSSGGNTAKTGGNSVVLEGKGLDTTLTKDVEISAATSGTYTATIDGDAKLVAGGKATYTVRYIDESGVENEKDITVTLTASNAPAEDLAKALGDLGFKDMGGASASSGYALNLESNTAGSKGAQLKGITLKSSEDTAGNVSTYSKGEKAGTVARTGEDAYKSNTVEFSKAFEAGNTVTIGNKTYEFVDQANLQDVAKDHVAVVLGNDNDKTLDNLTQALNKNGVTARVSDATNRKIVIDDLSQISLNKGNVTFSSSTANIAAGDADATKGAWKMTAGAGTGDAAKLTIRYTDESGEEKTKILDYTGSTSASTNAENMKNAIMADDDLKKAFTVTVDPNNDASLRIEANTKGSSGAQIKTITSNDATSTAISEAVNTVAKGTDAGKGITVNSGVKVGDTVTIGGKTFEFASADGADKVTSGNTAVILGDTTAKTTENLNNALVNAGFKTDYNAGMSALKVISGSGSSTSADGGLTLQVGDTADDYNKVTVSVDDMSSSGLNIANLQVTDQGLAADSITKVKAAIEKVSTNRGRLGALQNRLEHTINNLSTTSENMTAAESRIRDTDMAKEMMAFTKNNVLVQAAQSMLAQANQQPQQVLQLLR